MEADRRRPYWQDSGNMFLWLLLLDCDQVFIKYATRVRSSIGQMNYSIYHASLSARHFNGNGIPKP